MKGTWYIEVWLAHRWTKVLSADSRQKEALKANFRNLVEGCDAPVRLSRVRRDYQLVTVDERGPRVGKAQLDELNDFAACALGYKQVGPGRWVSQLPNVTPTAKEITNA